MIYEYDVLSPSNERELSELLRLAPLTKRSLELTVTKVLDELSIRRGQEVDTDEIKMVFEVHAIHLKRPTFIIGAIAIEETARMARLEAIGDDEDDQKNPLRLYIG